MQTEAHATQPDDLYPRWYLTFSGFFWGLTVGLGVATCLYELGVWHVGDFWRMQLSPALFNFLPMMCLTCFEIFFRVRHHLRLQRRIERAPTER